MLFHPLSSHFLKENPFSCVGRLGLLGPKGVFGCQDVVQKVSGGSDDWLQFGPRANFDDSCFLAMVLQASIH